MMNPIDDQSITQWARAKELHVSGAISLASSFDLNPQDEAE